METWILTFERPKALERLVKHFNEQKIVPNIFSNSPDIDWNIITNHEVGDVVINSLNCKESNSWCARSWNTIYMKAFDRDEELICIQDDTDISPDFGDWIAHAKDRFNFIWGPAGDQFHFIRKSVLQMVGWWDERYIGCYCGDAEYVKRVFMEYDTNWISVEDSHNWGFRHNPCDIGKHVITTYESKTVDPDYDNQHWEFEKLAPVNTTILNSQQHFRDKWGVDLDNNKPVISSLNRRLTEIDWYPWATKKFGIIAYEQ